MAMYGFPCGPYSGVFDLKVLVYLEDKATGQVLLGYKH
jgi:hypothetical protein